MKRARQLVLILFRDALGRFARLPRAPRSARKRRARRRPTIATSTAVQLTLF